MMALVQKLWRLFQKYKAVLNYLFFGVCATLVNVLGYAAFAHGCGLSTTASAVLAQVVAISFAYVTNKLWVFGSKVWSLGALVREVLSFFACRAATGVLDVAFMFVTVDLLGLNDIVMKLLSNAIGMVLNYLASKFWIFVKR